MGTGPSLPLAKEDSIVSPGKPSIVSDPVPSEIDYNTFLDELISILKYPVAPTLEAVLQEVKITEAASGPDEFQVQVILDPAKLQAYGYHNPDSPSLARIQTHMKVKLDREARHIETTNMQEYWQGEEAKVAIHTHVDFTKDPLRLDYYWLMPDGTRMADDMVLAALAAVTTPLMSALADRKVVVKMDDAKQVYTCDPIDESITTAEPFFNALLALMKEPRQGSVVEDLSATKFKVIPPDDKLPYQTFTFDKEKCTITNELFSSDGTKKISTTQYSVSKSPFTFEFSVDGQDGERLFGKGKQRIFQGMVDGAITKATSGWGFGLF